MVGVAGHERLFDDWRGDVGVSVEGAAAKRIVLGDWDKQGWALQVDEQGFQLAAFDFVNPQLALPGA